MKLVHKQVVTKTKRDGDTAYERDNFYYAHRNEIFKRADGLRGGGERPQTVLATRPPGRVDRAALHRPNLREPQQNYETFHSHASDYKAAVARPLYRALTRAGVTVWYDEGVLTIGDSLRRKIDDGLSRCRFGIVILSPKFFSKDWPQRELDGLVARENTSGEKAILPVWHNLTKSQVAKFSPTLADRLAGNSKDGVSSLVRKIKEALEASPKPRRRAS